MSNGSERPATRDPTNERLAYELRDEYTEEKLGMKVSTVRLGHSPDTYGGYNYSVTWDFLYGGTLYVKITPACEYEVSVWMGIMGDPLRGYYRSDRDRSPLRDRVEAAVLKLKAAIARVAFAKDLTAFLVTHAPKSETPMKTISLDYGLLVPFVWNTMKVSATADDVLKQLEYVFDDAKLLEPAFVAGLDELRERARKHRDEERLAKQKRKRGVEEEEED